MLALFLSLGQGEGPPRGSAPRSCSWSGNCTRAMAQCSLALSLSLSLFPSLWPPCPVHGFQQLQSTPLIFPWSNFPANAGTLRHIFHRYRAASLEWPRVCPLTRESHRCVSLIQSQMIPPVIKRATLSLTGSNLMSTVAICGSLLGRPLPGYTVGLRRLTERGQRSLLCRLVVLPSLMLLPRETRNLRRLKLRFALAAAK